LISLDLFEDIQGQSDAAFAVQQLACNQAILRGIGCSVGMAESLQQEIHMPRQIDYYFSLQSPWAYIGHKPFVRLISH
jgi:hypothetical protein